MENKKIKQKKRDPWAETEQETRQFEKRQRSLDRYLEGWIVREVLQRDGTVLRERVYVGDYYASCDTKKQTVLRKIGYCLLFAAAIALFVVSAIQPVGANMMGFVGLSQGVVLMAVIWVMCSLFTYITAPRKMTVSDYKGGALAVKRSSFFMAIAYLLPALATLVHIFIDASDLMVEILCILGYLAAGALLFLVHRIESHMVYEKTPSPEKNSAHSAFAAAFDEIEIEEDGYFGDAAFEDEENEN